MLSFDLQKREYYDHGKFGAEAFLTNNSCQDSPIFIR